MRAITVVPGQPGTAALTDLPDGAGRPHPAPVVSVQTSAVGVCGTDREIASGGYCAAPEGDDRLVLGHEAVGRVLEAPGGGDLEAGDLVVPIVRRPDPVPCPACAAGEWDMCRNGRYVEHGIDRAHGYARDRFDIDPAFLLRVPERLGHLGALVEPTSVVAKAWEQIDRIGHRAVWTPRVALVTGAGPVGLLAALIGVQAGLEVHVVDLVDGGPKPRLAEALGATYHSTPVAQLALAPDVVVECTGVGQVVIDAVELSGPAAVVCLAGLSTGSHPVELDPGAVNRRLVLENEVVFGSVNANRRHYAAAVDALAAADPAWLAGLVTRTVPVASFADALTHQPDDVKVLIDFAPDPAPETSGTGPA
jgi:threonine dehydrogenase-like Zn-dependent dehydrogenase